MICMFGAALVCAFLSTLATLPGDRAAWACAALGWAAIAVLSRHLG